jgi:hypothetical protein
LATAIANDARPDRSGEERMDVVFDTRTLAAGKRREAWRDAICEIYLQVDCRIDPGEARLGEVTITDAVIYRPKPSAGATTISAASQRIVTTSG